MEIKDFIKLLKEKNLSLAAENGKLILKGDKSKLTDGEINPSNGKDFIVNYIKGNKEELIKYISNSEEFITQKKSKDISSIYRLSGLQEGMLFHGLYDEKSGTHIVQLTCDFTDPDLKIFDKSWDSVMNNHTVLRSSIQYDTFNLPVQCVHGKVKLPVEILDYRSLLKEDQITAMIRFKDEDRLKGFEFKTAPLMRVTLFRLDDHKYKMLWTSHHIIFDGWSLQILMEEFLQTYETLSSGTEVKKSAEDKYEDYIKFISNSDKEKQENYWREYMDGVEQSTLLPFIKTTTQRTKAAGNYKTLLLNIDKNTTGQIEKYAQKHRLTINSIMQGVWSYLLHKYTGLDDITFGTIVSGRPDELHNVEKRVGMFINTIPLHSRLNREIKISEWLQGIQNEQTSSQQFQFTPLYDIQGWAGIQGDLFDSILVYENYPISKVASSKKWKLKVENVEVTEQTNYPFIITVSNPGNVIIEFQYNSDLLSNEYVKEIQNHFGNVLEQIVSNDELCVKEIKLLSEKEEHQLLHEFNDTNVDYPKDKTIADLFEEQVSKTPDNTALVLGNRSMTYRELNERSNQLAHYLQSKGVGKETLVPICIERSFEMIIGILGIVKAGGVYVPVDPDYPEDRIEYILDDTSSSIVLSSKESCAKLKSDKKFDVIKIDEDRNEINKYSKDNPAHAASPKNGAYIIYTSGSTGKPKGVIVQHYNVVRLFMTSSPLFDFTEKDVWTMFHSFCFDFTVWEMYGTFFFGGKLVLVPKQVTKDAELFSDLLIKEKVTVLNQIPSSFYALQEVLTEKGTNSIRYIIFGGEALDPAKLKLWKKLNPDCKLINMYGITETTVHVTYQEIESKHINTGNSIIGKPIPTLSLHILDSDFNLLPVGIAGELCIGGAGLARGYLNRPELTKERFIDNPYIKGERLYRSGDLGKRLPDGNIEYLGRIDEQVKIRGYRIELGEIESVLNECEFVMQSLVIAKADKENNKKLVAYVVPEGKLDRDKIAAYVKGKLPEYMVPSQWVELEKFPMTPSGKIDKKALPEADGEMLSNIYIAPVSDGEKKVASVWMEVLGIGKVGINDNFFELGGDSIKVIRVVHRLRKLFGKEIKVFDIYNSGSLTELVSLIEKIPITESRWNELLTETEKEISSLKEKLLPLLPDPEKIEDVYPVSDIQSGMIFASLVNPESALYHDQMVYRLSEKIDLDLFKKALGMMVKKHSILRTAFNFDVYETGLQIIYKDVPVKASVFEMPDVTEPEARSFILEYLKTERSIPFEINKAPLWRAALIYLKDQTVFLFQTHHAILDGWSVAAFTTELNNLYLDLLKNSAHENRLLPLASSYRDFVIENLAGKKNDDNKMFWKNEMSDYKRLDIFGNETGYVRLNKAYSKDHLNKLISRTKQDGLSLKGIFLAAYLYTLGLLTYEDDLTIGLVTNLRPLKEDGEKILGCFLNTTPFRFRNDQKFFTWKNYFEFVEKKLKDIKQSDRTTLPDIAKFAGEKSANENPFFDVVFNFINFHVLDNVEKGLSEPSELISETTDAGEFESMGYAVTNTYLDCSVSITGDELSTIFSLRKNLKSGKTLKDLSSYFEKVIECYLELYDEPVSRDNILPATERSKLLNEFNNTKTEYRKNKTFIDLFCEHAAKSGDSVAISYDKKTLTYRELNEFTNQLANYIQSKNVKPGTFIPLCMNRGTEIIAAMIAIMKAGCAYVPIDPQYPEERIRFMIEDTQSPLVITDKNNKAKLISFGKNTLIDIDADESKIKKLSKEYSDPDNKPNDLAYVVYTSGSTGKPKGVMVEHHSLTNLIDWHIKEYKVTAESKATQTASPGFDAFGWEVWPYLAESASVTVVDDNKRVSPVDLMELLVENKITHSFIATALMDEFISISKNKNSSLQFILTGGDKLSAIDRDGLNFKIVNNYGPTENTVVATSYKLPDKNIYEVPLIGKPISNTEIYIVNKNQELSPSGVEGEICISGESLARGYLNSNELTLEKFISNPYSAEHSMMYKTGDLARWHEDGNIEFLGRIDEQVKIRGFRIELGEIENILNESDLIKSSVVIVKTDGQGVKRLIGYVTPKENFDKEKILSYLGERLPDYMIPSLWVEMESFPLTANGKIDKKGLPDPDVNELLGNEYVAPRNEIEEKLAEIWSELLHIERIGINDNFFELGGDSIISIQVISRARRQGIEMQPRDLFYHQTIGSLSKALSERTSASIIGEQGILTGESGLLPIQQWYLNSGNKNISHFNQSVLLSIDKSVSKEILLTVSEKLIEHHDALRFKFYKEDDQWHQKYEQPTNIEKRIFEEDIRNSNEKLEDQIPTLADNYQRSLDIENGDLIRFVLFKTSEKEKFNRLLVIIHHLAVDGVSWRIILEDLELLITQFKDDKKLSLAEKTTSYRQWYDVLRKYGMSRNIRMQTNYWEQIERNYEPLISDNDYKGAVTAKDMLNETIKLDKNNTQLLIQQVPKAYHTEINDILLCALALTICSSSQKKITIGLEGHGRENISKHVDTGRTVGWFTNIFPVMLEPGDSNDLSKVIKSVKEQIRNVPDKGIGFGVLKYINKEKNLSEKDCWDILFNYLGQLDNVVSSGKWLQAAGESRGSGRSEDTIVNEKLSINSFVRDGELTIDWSYSSLHFDSKTISKLIKSYSENLKLLIKHCAEKIIPDYTPSDFGLGADINFEEFDKFLNESFEGKRRKDFIESIYRLSGLQEGMLFHGLYDEKAGAYTEQLKCDLKNPNIKIIQESWNYVLKNHSILRSGFYYNVFRIPVQCVYRDVEVPVTILDYRNLNEKEKQISLKNFEGSDRAKNFDFRKAPLMRVTLVRLSEEDYRMYWTWHHILFDGWSMPVLMEEFLNSYEIIKSKKNLPVKPEDKFEDYIRYIESEDKERQENFWRSYMSGVEHSTLLPFVEMKSQRTKGIGEYETLNLNLSGEITSRIEIFAHKNHLTVNTLMQGVWAYILHQYTSSTDQVYGIIVSGRPDNLFGVENRVGLYINTLPLHSTLNNEQSINEWLKNIQEQQIASRQYQYTPFKDIQALTELKGDLFDSLLAFENFPVNEILKSKKWGLDVSNVIVREQTNYPLTIIIRGSKQLNILFNYNTNLLKENYVNEIRNHFENVLMQIISNEKKTIGKIELLTSEEKVLLSGFNNTEAEYPADKTILDLFEEQVLKDPDAAALMFEDETMTYSALNENANKLAHYLRSKGIKNEMLIPVCINRSFEMIIALLGILKAGGTYIPVDPDYPTDLINYMLDDSKPGIILADKKFISERDTARDVEVICIEDNHEINECSGQNLDDKVSYDHILCVIYTSGSSGKPKGVKVGNAGMLNRFYWMWNAYPFGKNEKCVIKTSLSFGDHVWEIFGPLLKGVCSVILRKIDILDIDTFIEKLSSNKITRLVLVPSLLRELLYRIDENGRKLDHLKYWTCSGEAISFDLVESFYSNFPEKDHKLLNIYGSTEVSADATYFETSNSFIKQNEFDHESNSGEVIQRNVPIGKPIANAKVYISNSEDKLLPVGVTGEIYVGGKPVGEGYLNRPELTSEKFVDDPFTKNPEAKIFKTGDLGRWLPGGDIEYLGRSDYQVKIRGFRVELGEIENVLKESGLVNNVVVLVQKGKDGSNHLVGYVIPKKVFSKKELTSYLRDHLPDYMVPELWVELEVLPLTPSGKIDKKLLPNVDVTEGLSSKFIAPETDVEKKLAEIWKELLQVEQIGVEDNFFELGGHSLLAMRLISAIRKQFEIELGIKDLFIHPTISSLIALMQIRIKERVLPPVVKKSNQKNIPLSFAQERLWFIDKLEGSIQYHMPAALRLKGKLNVAALEEALSIIIKRHEVLRTVFVEDEEKVYQNIIDVNNWKLKIVDDVAFKKGNDSLKKYIHELVNTPFDLSRDYMLRAVLIKLSDEDNVLVVTMHHIASDAWSLSVIVKELVEIYNSIIERRKPLLSPLSIQYSDYAIWQRENINDLFLDDKLEYWKSKLSDTQPLNLPSDFERPAIQNIEGTNIEFSIDKEMTGQLKELSQQNGTTLFMTLMTVFKVLLYRYSNQQDICAGTSVSNRLQKETEDLVGFFVNMLAIRNDVSGDKTFTGLLQEVKETMIEAYENQEVPFEKVVDAVVKQRDMNRSPLFQVLFILLNTPEIQELKLGDVKMSYENYEHTTAQFDLNFLLSESPEGLTGFVGYRTSLYNVETIQRMISHFNQLVNSILQNPDVKISELPMLTREEENQLLFEFNNTRTSYPKNKSIAELFEEQVEKNPKSIAVVFEDEQLTYEELNKRSNKLAHFLKSKGVGREKFVAVCIGRSPELITGILGILKTGAAYVPIDADYPSERIKYMLEDTDADILLTGKVTGSKLPRKLHNDITIIDLEKDHSKIDKEDDENFRSLPDADDLAYVIYTSGSTGTPKGVMVTNKNVVSLVKGINYVNVSEGDVLLSTGSTAFDASTFEYWSMLLNGGQLVLCQEKNLLDSELLKEEIRKRKVKIMWFTSSWFNQLVDTDISVFEGLRTILAGGEKLSRQHINKVRKSHPEIEIINGYGPTENTTFSLTYKISEKELSADVPVGKPLSNRTAYILDENFRLCPAGVTGEICTGGDGVARGYLNNEGLTSEKFIENPYNKNEKLYRTGDTGRWLSDGNIEYLGRIDDQVKIRGYRIELGEIESVLMQSEMVRQAVVVVREDKGDKRLIGYVVPEDNFDRENIFDSLKGKLPEYMIPALLIELDEMPLTSNGKIDKSALPEPDVEEYISNEFVEPRNDVEKLLAEIWQDVLEVDRVGIHDNFFELGGDSIIIIQILSRFRRSGHELQVSDIFTYQTIAALSEVIQHREESITNISAEQSLLQGECGLLPIQQWFFETEQEDISHFNQSLLLSINKSVSESSLRKAVEQLIEHHDALRLRYFKKENVWHQEYGNHFEKLATVDLHTADESNLESLIKKHSDEFQASLNIEKGEVAKFVLLQTPKKELYNRILIIIHHLVVDGVSWRIMLDDLETLLTGFQKDIKPDLGFKTSSYRQWYDTLVKYGNSENLLSQKKYWEQTSEKQVRLKVDDAYTGIIRSKDVSSHLMKLDQENTHSLLKEVPKAYHTEINDILICALAMTFSEWNSSNKIIIGLEGHGRENISEDIDTSRTVGWFTNLYPLMLHLPRTQNISDKIKSVKEQLRRVPEKGLGYGVLKYINKEEKLSGSQSWEIVFNYLGQLDNVISTGKWLSAAKESSGSARSGNTIVHEKISVNCSVQGGELLLNWNYSTQHFRKETIEGLSESYRQNLIMLISHCIERQKSGVEYTPSDYGLGSEIGFDELDVFLNEKL